MTKKQQDNKQLEIQKLQEQVRQLEENWKRALADYKNLESRIERQKADVMRFSMAPLLLKLFSVLDHLNLAVEHHQSEDWVRLIRDQLRDILLAEGIEEIPALGTEFDPVMMECVEQVEGERDKVIKVVEIGYRQGDKVLRHAKVQVGKGERNEQTNKQANEQKNTQN